VRSGILSGREWLPGTTDNPSQTKERKVQPKRKPHGVTPWRRRDRMLGGTMWVSRRLSRRPLLSSRLFIRAGRTEPEGAGELFPNLFAEHNRSPCPDLVWALSVRDDQRLLFAHWG
jgi:hypothetical protein